MSSNEGADGNRSTAEGRVIDDIHRREYTISYGHHRYTWGCTSNLVNCELRNEWSVGNSHRKVSVADWKRPTLERMAYKTEERILL